MNPPFAGASGSSRRRKLVILAASLLAIGMVALGLGMLTSPDQTTPAATFSGSPTPMAPRPEEQAPKNESRRVHRALHAIGRICESGDTSERTALVRPQIETILGFARRFPDVSFPIDDETGSTVALLIVTRDGVRTCAPSLMGKVNGALPPEYQLPDSTD